MTDFEKAKADYQRAYSELQDAKAEARAILRAATVKFDKAWDILVHARMPC